MAKSIAQLRNSSAALRKEFDRHTEEAYATIHSLHEKWAGSDSVSGALSIADFYKYTGARTTIFYFASEMAKILGDEESRKHFIGRDMAHSYDDFFFEMACMERVPRVVGVTKKNGRVAIHMDDVLPGLDF